MASPAAPQPIVVVVFFTWFVSNITINLYNKFVLSKAHFHFPILLTMTNKAIGWLGSIVVMYISSRLGSSKLPEVSSLLHQFRRPMVHAHGVLTAFNIGFNNWSLLTISITLNQLIKSAAPLPTAGLSVALEGKSYPWQIYASMSVVVLGTGLAAIGSASFDAAGVIFCLLSVLASAGWTVLSAILLQRGADRLDAVGLVFVSSPTSIVVLLAMFLAGLLPAPPRSPPPLPDRRARARAPRTHADPPSLPHCSQPSSRSSLITAHPSLWEATAATSGWRQV